MMNRNDARVTILLLCLILCSWMNVAASTRLLPFVRRLHSSPPPTSNNNNTIIKTNETFDSTTSTLPQDAKDNVTESSVSNDDKTAKASAKKRPVSNWFSRMNQKSLQAEEKERQHEDEGVIQEKNETSVNTTKETSSEWPKGRYWPSSSSSRTQHEKPPSSNEITETESPQETSDVNETAKDDTVESDSQSLSFNPFRNLRHRFKPSSTEPETQQPQDSPIDSSPQQQDERQLELLPTTPTPDSDTEKESSDGKPFFSRLQESATTAKKFLRQLPWKPPSNVDTNNAVVVDAQTDNKTLVQQVPGDSNMTSSLEEGTDLVQDSLTEPPSANDEKLSQSGAESKRAKDSNVSEPSLLTSLKDSAINTTAFLRRQIMSKIHKNSNTTTTFKNPISIIRNLPWTPEGAKKFVQIPNQTSPQIKVNPFQLVRGLPWTPQRKDSHVARRDGGNETKQELSTDDAPPNVDSVKQDNATEVQDETSHDDVKTEEEGEKEEEDEDVTAMEVDDVLSKYLLRQEEFSSSDDERDVIDEDASTEGPMVSEGDAIVEDKDWGGREDAQSDSVDTATLGLDSMVRRFLGSFEDQQKSIESKLKTKELVVSNATSTQQNVTDTAEKSTDSTTEEGAAANKTSVPVQKDEKEEQRQQQQQMPPLPPQQPTVIIMGGPQQDGRALPAELGRRPVPTPSLVLVEALATILGTAIRIWMISFLAKWWSEEETLRPVQHFVWERVNERYLRDATALQNVMQLPPAGVTEWKWRRFLRKQRRVEGKILKKQPLPPQTFARTVIVLNIGPEMNILHLEQAVTFILSQHREQAFGSIGGLAKELEVVIQVNSPGGAVSDYGLAGAQVRRLAQEAGITTTAVVDQIAASGGYMIASQADRIYASTFAVVGSIGVIREGINIHDALERHGIKGLVLKAGDSKVPLTMFGKVTKSDVSKAQRTLDLMHGAFKEFVVQGRPTLEGDIEEVANGDIYFGSDALARRLVDRIVTSEEYLLERVQAGDRVMKIHRAHQFVGRRKLFHPLDFLREKGAPLRTAFTKWIASDMDSLLTRTVAATSVIGAAKFLSQHRF